jgi:hypothetical protein
LKKNEFNKLTEPAGRLARWYELRNEKVTEEMGVKGNTVQRTGIKYYRDRSISQNNSRR